MQLKGKRALITGAGSGIGRALAIDADRQGMTVALSGRRVDALRETAAMMGLGTRHVILPGDVTLPATRRELGAFLEQNWGELDLLVNNAGIIHAGPFTRTSDDDLYRIMATNVIAPAALTRELLPLLRKETPSRIVNIGSMFGDIPYPLFGVYSASKFALRGLSIALRREFKPLGVGVTYAAPRATRTDATRAIYPLTKSLQMRLDEPEAVAASIWRAVERDADTAYARGPERLFVFFERLFPMFVDRAIARQMADFRVQNYVNALCSCARADGPANDGNIKEKSSPLAPIFDTASMEQNKYSQSQNVSEEQDDAK